MAEKAIIAKLLMSVSQDEAVRLLEALNAVEGSRLKATRLLGLTRLDNPPSWALRFNTPQGTVVAYAKLHNLNLNEVNEVNYTAVAGSRLLRDVDVYIIKHCPLELVSKPEYRAWFKAVGDSFNLCIEYGNEFKYARVRADSSLIRRVFNIGEGMAVEIANALRQRSSGVKVHPVVIGPVRFLVKRKSVGWLITVEDDESFMIPLTRARDVLRPRFIERVFKYLQDRGVNTPREAVYDAFTQFYSNVRIITKLTIPSGAVPVFVRIPIDYIRELNTPVTLTYTVRSSPLGESYIPVILMNINGEVREVEVQELLRGIHHGGYIIKLSSLLYTPPSQLEEGDFEEFLSNATESLIEELNATIPRLSDVEDWLRVIKDSGVEAFEFLRQFLNQASSFVRQFTWRGLTTNESVVLSLIPFLPILGGVPDFILKVVFTAPYGSGKSYHMGAVSAFMPYTIFLEESSPATLSRLLDGAYAVVLDDPRISPELAKVLIQAFRRRAVRAITDMTRGGRVITLNIGGLVILPNLNNQLADVNESDALFSRAMVINLVKDRRMASILDAYEEVRGRVMHLRVGKLERDVKVSELYPLITALYLLNAVRLREAYLKLNDEVSAMAKEGKLPVEPRLVQAYAPLILLARVTGLEDAVWGYLRAREVSSTQNEALTLLSNVAEELLKHPIPSIDDYTYTAGDGGDRVILIRPSGLIATATYVRLGELGLVVDRLQVQEGENATLRDMERWVRRELPREFTNEQRLSALLRSIPFLNQLLVNARRKGSGEYVRHLIITSEFPTLIQLIMAGEAKEAGELASSILTKACRQLTKLIEENTVKPPCSGGPGDEGSAGPPARPTADASAEPHAGGQAGPHAGQHAEPREQAGGGGGWVGSSPNEPEGGGLLGRSVVRRSEFLRRLRGGGGESTG